MSARLGATPEELAAWIWNGPQDGGIAAYMNANELDPPPRFFYTPGSDNQDYIAPSMGCWFKVEDIDQFEPADRYITGSALIERWSQRPAFLIAVSVSGMAGSRSSVFWKYPQQASVCNTSRWTLENKKAPWIGAFRGVFRTVLDSLKRIFGGVDGTRTRDPRRDRPVF